MKIDMRYSICDVIKLANNRLTFCQILLFAFFCDWDMIDINHFLILVVIFKKNWQYSCHPGYLLSMELVWGCGLPRLETGGKQLTWLSPKFKNRHTNTSEGDLLTHNEFCYFNPYMNRNMKAIILCILCVSAMSWWTRTLDKASRVAVFPCLTPKQA